MVEIPAIPKSMVINVGALACIALLLMGMGLVAAYFIPKYRMSALGINDTTTPSKLDVSFDFTNNPKKGADWPIEATLYNSGTSSIYNITLIAESNADVEGDTKTLEMLQPQLTKTIKLTGHIKDNALEGTTNVVLRITSPNIDTTEANIRIDIQPPA